MTDQSIAEMILNAAEHMKVDLRSTFDLSDEDYAHLHSAAHPTEIVMLVQTPPPAALSLTSDGGSWYGTYGVLVHTLLRDLATDKEITHIIIDVDEGTSTTRYSGYYLQAPTESTLTMIDGVVVELGSVVGVYIP